MPQRELNDLHADNIIPVFRSGAPGAGRSHARTLLSNPGRSQFEDEALSG
jgi:predicted ArsR family transcriptional regulator